MNDPFIARSLEETRILAHRCMDAALKAPVDGACMITLSGDLGTGKTTFVQMCAEAIGIHEPVRSPTYLIMESYDINWGRFHRFFHIDAYRLESEHELLLLGWHDIVRDPSHLIMIEWPEKVASSIPESAYHVAIQHMGHGEERVFSVPQALGIHAV